MKQKVFVPKYAGEPVFECYCGIPAEDFLKTLLRKAIKFVNKYPCQVNSDDISVEGDEIVICSARIRPTKFGVDSDRFWIFDEQTLKDINLKRV